MASPVATQAYSISDPVQDGDHIATRASLREPEVSAGGDRCSGLDEFGDTADLDYLFEDFPTDAFEADHLVQDGAELLLPDLDLFLDRAGQEPLDRPLDPLPLSTRPVPVAKTSDIRSMEPQNIMQHASTISHGLSCHGLTLPTVPLYLSSGSSTASTISWSSPAQSLPNLSRTASSVPPVNTLSDLGIAAVSTTSRANQSLPVSNTVVATRAGIVLPMDRTSEISAEVLTSSIEQQQPYHPRASPLLMSSVNDHLTNMHRSTSLGHLDSDTMRGRSRTALTPPSSASPQGMSPVRTRSQPESVSAGSTNLIRRGNCSPIRSLFSQETPDQAVPKKGKPASKKRKLSHKVDTSDTPKENLRHSLMLDPRTYHYLVEKVKVFMLDNQHPQRLAEVVLANSKTAAKSKSSQSTGMQNLAETLLQDEELAENWWGDRSVGYESRELKWPRDKSSIVTNVIKLLVQVCQEHLKDPRNRPVISTNDRQDITSEITNCPLPSTYNVKGPVECHVSFVSAENVLCAVRDKVVVSTDHYQKYMDLVNFLVRLITDEYIMTGLGILGPLGYARVNNQADWDAMMEVIRTTPTMSSIALCTVETQPLHRRGKFADDGQPPRARRTPVREVIQID